jgi:hypothetical protein
MSNASLAPALVFKGFDNNGNPLANGQLFTYAAGSSTPVTTYTDSTASTPNTNPVILNSRGEANVNLLPNTAYKFVLEDSSGNLIWTVDQVTQLQLLSLVAGADTGVANYYQVTLASPLVSYAAGMALYFIPSNTNTGPSTLSVSINGGASYLGAVGIVNPGLVPLSAGQLVAGNVYFVLYSAGVFLLTTPIGSTGSVSVASVNVTGSTAPLNGIFEPATNTVGIAANGVNQLNVSSGEVNVLNSLAVGAPAGGALGTGTINCTGIYVNGQTVGIPLLSVASFPQNFTGTSLSVYSISGSLVANGTYQIEVLLNLYASLAGSGYKVNMQITGTAPIIWTPLVGLQTVALASPAACMAINGGTNIVGTSVSTTLASPDIVWAKTVFTNPASATTFDIMVAQNSATGTLTVGAGSTVIITRLQ